MERKSTRIFCSALPRNSLKISWRSCKLYLGNKVYISLVLVACTLPLLLISYEFQLEQICSPLLEVLPNLISLTLFIVYNKGFHVFSINFECFLHDAHRQYSSRYPSIIYMRGRDLYIYWLLRLLLLQR